MHAALWVLSGCFLRRAVVHAEQWVPGVWFEGEPLCTQSSGYLGSGLKESHCACRAVGTWGVV